MKNFFAKLKCFFQFHDYEVTDPYHMSGFPFHLRCRRCGYSYLTM